MMSNKIAKRAKIGDRISFIRKMKTFEGVVELVRDNSVIIAISREATKRLDYDTTRTVVKHSNYTIINPVETA
ncbi:YkvS family protein [Mesobacillus jeotgali]|uniref:YkvS family protein n=1 Tax=Mesobacillus jeotgali TaxID=129985 RepID=UPI0021485E8E|nr:YkvS family protein [Mesobacillus jeotgali]